VLLAEAGDLQTSKSIQSTCMLLASPSLIQVAQLFPPKQGFNKPWWSDSHTITGPQQKAVLPVPMHLNWAS
jgi:hypothetical protein